MNGHGLPKEEIQQDIIDVTAAMHEILLGFDGGLSIPIHLRLIRDAVNFLATGFDTIVFVPILGLLVIPALDIVQAVLMDQKSELARRVPGLRKEIWDIADGATDAEVKSTFFSLL